MKETLPPCFFMLCTNKTEKECLTRKLFGDSEWRFPHIQMIKSGYIGFLINITKDCMLGIFVAESKPRLNIVSNAWEGKFPAQIKVKILGELQTVEKASEKLEEYIPLRALKIRGGAFRPRIPSKTTYGPDITKKILSLFNKGIENSYKQKHFKTENEYEFDYLENYSLEEVAGLEEIKKFVFQRIIAPFEDEKTAYSLKLRVGGGILLYGPPGTGKTLIAQSIAKSIQAKFIDISPSVIIGYPGEAEKRLERIFTSLENEPRAVIFLDEAEWILGRREEQTSSVMQRITPVLLAQLSRFFKEKSRPVIVIAATNRPEMIDSAFLRPERFDKIFYVSLPDKKARIDIIRLHLKDRKNMLNNEEIELFSDKLDGYSGADISFIIEEAAFLAFERRKEDEVGITLHDLEKVLERTPKSTTGNEIKMYENWGKKRGYQI